MPARYLSPKDIEEMLARGYDVSTIQIASAKLDRWKELEDLKASIRVAFGKVELGGGVGLWQGQALDGYADPAKEAAARQRDEKHDWQTISADTLNKCSSSLSFFDAEGMRFHLPAFMTADLNREFGQDLVYTLTCCPDERFVLLNEAQVQVVRSFLAFMLGEPEHETDRERIESALAERWVG